MHSDYCVDCSHVLYDLMFLRGQTSIIIARGTDVEVQNLVDKLSPLINYDAVLVVEEAHDGP